MLVIYTGDVDRQIPTILGVPLADSQRAFCVMSCIVLCRISFCISNSNIFLAISSSVPLYISSAHALSASCCLFSLSNTALSSDNSCLSLSICSFSFQMADLSLVIQRSNSARFWDYSCSSLALTEWSQCSISNCKSWSFLFQAWKLSISWSNQASFRSKSSLLESNLAWSS